MCALSAAGDYQVFGRYHEIDGVPVHAARKTTDRKAELVSLHHLAEVSRTGEQQLRQLADRTRAFADPMVVAPREVVRSPDGVFVVTDFFAGETLDQILKSHRNAISKILAVSIARDVAHAVERLRAQAAGALFGDISSSQVLVSHGTGQLKLIVVGAALIRGRGLAPSTSNIGEVLREMLGGKKAPGGRAASNVTSDLGRIVSGAISSSSSELGQIGVELSAYLETRTVSADRSSELQKLIQQHFSHKAKAMSSLTERWRSQAAPRSASGSRAPSVPPRTNSGTRAPSDVRPPEAPLGEPEIAIVEPVELVRTEDISKNGLVQKRAAGWPRARLVFLLLLLALCCGTAALALMNDDARTIPAAWSSVLLGRQ